MFKVEKIFCDLISDSDVILTKTRKGNRYSKRYYVKGILHIVVTTDNTTQDIVEIKITKIIKNFLTYQTPSSTIKE